MRFNTGVSIKLLLSAVIGVLSLMLIGVSTGPLLQAVKRVSVAQRVVALSGISEHLFGALQNFRIERSLVGAALLADQPVSPQTQQKISQFRQEAEQGFQQSLDMMTNLELPGVSEARERLHESHEKIRALRETANKAALLQKGQRDPALATAFVAEGETFLQALMSATDLIDAAIRRHDATIDALLTIKRSAWTVRTNVGVAAILVTEALAERKPFTKV